jgi:hypothetical protein
MKKIEAVHKAFMRHWEKVLYFDSTIREKELDTRQRSRLKDYRNPHYWIYYAKDKGYDKKQYQSIIKDHSDDIKSQITRQLETSYFGTSKFVSFRSIDERGTLQDKVCLNQKENYSYQPL